MNTIVNISGPLPDIVIQQQIDSEIDDDEAHRYFVINIYFFFIPLAHFFQTLRGRCSCFHGGQEWAGDVNKLLISFLLLW